LKLIEAEIEKKQSRESEKIFDSDSEGEIIVIEGDDCVEVKYAEKQKGRKKRKSSC
jgi:hypothetical protein